MAQKEVEKSPSSLRAGPWSLSFVGEVRQGWDEAETKTGAGYRASEALMHKTSNLKKMFAQTKYGNHILQEKEKYSE